MRNLVGFWYKNANVLGCIVLLLLAGREFEVQRQQWEHRDPLAKAAVDPKLEFQMGSSNESGISALSETHIKEGKQLTFSEYVAPICNMSGSLQSVLSSAATPDKIVIVTTFTTKFAPMLDLFLGRIQLGNTTAPLRLHIVVLNFDEEGFQYCCQQRLHCYFDTQLWRRLAIMREVVKMGYNVLLTDVDIVWLQNPFKELNTDAADMQFASDFHVGGHNFQINAGFYFARATPQTIAFMDHWATMGSRSPELVDQDVLMRILPDRDNFTANEVGVKIRYLPTHLMGGFCEMPEQLDQLITIHANCCLGLNVKLEVMQKILDAYDLLMSLPSLMRSQLHFHGFKWRYENMCKFWPV